MIPKTILMFFLVLMFRSDLVGSRRTGAMDESVSSVKTVKPSQSRGAKVSSAQKPNKDGVKSALRSKENLTAAKDERSGGGVASRTAAGAFPENSLEKKKSRPSRLSGRTGSGERGKGKAAESKTAQPAEGAPVPPVTPERAKGSTGATAREKSHGGSLGSLHNVY